MCFLSFGAMEASVKHLRSASDAFIEFGSLQSAVINRAERRRRFHAFMPFIRVLQIWTCTITIIFQSNTQYLLGFPSAFELILYFDMVPYLTCHHTNTVEADCSIELEKSCPTPTIRQEHIVIDNTDRVLALTQATFLTL